MLRDGREVWEGVREKVSRKDAPLTKKNVNRNDNYFYI